MATGKNTTAGKIVVKQIRSLIGRDQRVRGTLRALGLGRIGDTCEHPATPAIMGMVRRVRSVLEIQTQK